MSLRSRHDLAFAIAFKELDTASMDWEASSDSSSSSDFTMNPNLMALRNANESSLRAIQLSIQMQSMHSSLEIKE